MALQKGSGSVAPDKIQDDSRNNKVVTNGSSDQIEFTTNSVEQGIIDSSGNIVFGTPTGATGIEMIKSLSNTDFGLHLKNNSNGDVRLALSLASQAFAIGLDNSDNDYLKFSTDIDNVGNSTLMTLTPAGLLGILTTPTSTLHVNGSLALTISSLSSATTLDETHGNVHADATSAAFTLTLPPAANCPGRSYIVMKTDASSNAVTLDGDGTETINGDLTLALTGQYDWVEIRSNGSNWVKEGSNNLSGATVCFDDGSAAAPSVKANSDPNTGMYWSGADQLSFTTGGTERLRITTSAFEITNLPIHHISGSAGSPPYTFDADPDTGMYSAGADNLGFTVGGSVRFNITTAQTNSTLPFTGPDGSVSFPTFTFSNDTNTGIYSASADQMGLVGGGNLIARVTNTQFRLAGTNSAAVPALVSDSDTDTGLYWPATDELAISTAGVQRIVIDSNGNLGINDSSPARRLVVDNGTGSVAFDPNSLGTWEAVRVQVDNTHASGGVGIHLTTENGGTTKGVGIAAVSTNGTGGADELVFMSSSSNALSEVGRFSIDGHFGVGTGGAFVYNTPDIYSVIGSGSSTDSALFIRTSATGIGRLAFADNSGSDAGRFVGQISYNHSSNAMSFSVSGVEQLEINDTNARFRDGAAASPGITFLADDDTGIFRQATNTLGFSTAGVERLRINDSNIVAQSSAQFLGTVGTASSPSFSFESDSNSGLYSIGSDSVGISTAGVLKLSIDSTGNVNSISNTNAASVTRLALTWNRGIANVADNDTAVLQFLADSDTTSNAIDARICAISEDVTHASRSSAIGFHVMASGVLSEALRINSSSQLLFGDGSVTNPSISFINDADTGFYKPGAGYLAAVTNGVRVIEFTNTQRVHLAENGSAAAPSLAWTGDNDTGIYLASADAIGLSAGGQIRTTVDTSGILMNDGVIRNTDGSAAAPAFTFNSDVNTGIYSSAADAIGISLGGTQKVDISTSFDVLLNSFKLGDNTDNEITQVFESNRTAASQVIGSIRADWNNDSVASINFSTGTDTVNKDDGVITFHTQPNNAAGLVERVRIFASGNTSFSGSILAADGSATIPSISFLNDDNTGIFTSAADNMSIAAGGSKVADFNVSGLLLNVGGTATAPSVAWSGASENTGMYLVNTDTIGFSTDGTQRLQINAGGEVVVTSGQLRLTDGSAAAPAATFSSDTDTGMYSAGAGQLGFSTNTVEALRITNNQRIEIADAGTAALPSLAWISDTDTGIYNSGVNTLGVSAGGSLAFLVTTNRVQVPAGSEASPGLSFLTDVNSGIFSESADKLTISTGGTNRLSVDTAITSRNGTQFQGAASNGVGSPAFAFDSDTNTGIYNPSADHLGLVAGATETVRISNAGISINTGANPGAALEVNGAFLFNSAVNGLINCANSIRVNIDSDNNSTLEKFIVGNNQDTIDGLNELFVVDENGNVEILNTVNSGNGSAVSPAYSFTNDPNTGLYSEGPDSLGVSAGGVEQARFYANGLLIKPGAAATPSLAFIGDADTGIYSSAANQIGFSCGTSLSLEVKSTGIDVNGGVLTLGTADASSGNINAYENMTFNIDTDNDDTTRFFGWYHNGASGSGTELMNLGEDGDLGLLGAITIGDATTTANGTIRYTGSDIEGRVGGSWVSLSAGGAGGSSGVSGSVQFSDGASGFSSDGANFFWDDTNNRLGIRTNTPSNALTVQVSAADDGIYLTDSSNTLVRMTKENLGGRIIVLDNGSSVSQIGGGNSGDTFFNNGGNVGVGISAPATKLHVSNGAASVTPSANADELLIENSANAGITIATPNTAVGSIYFADPEGVSQGFLEYNHSANTFTIGASGSSNWVLTNVQNQSVKTGSAALPGIAFSSDTDTGIFSDSANVLSASTAGVERLRIGTSDIIVGGSLQLLVQGGSAAAPSLSFDGDTDTGIYRSGADQLSFTTAGTEQLRITTTAFEITNLPIHHIDGSAAAPSYTFDLDPDTGLFRVGADNLGFATNGVQRMNLSTGGLTSVVPIFGPAGSAAAPAFTFDSDPNTGIYSAAADNLGFTVGGSVRFNITTGQTNSTLPFTGPDGAVTFPTFTFSNDTNTGIYSAAADQMGLAAGGNLRVRVTNTQVRFEGTNTAAVPVIARDGDTDTGIFFPAFNELAITTGGAQRIVVDSNGNLGINDSSPARRLVVDNGTGSVAFDPNSLGTWEAVRVQVDNTHASGGVGIHLTTENGGEKGVGIAAVSTNGTGGADELAFMSSSSNALSEVGRFSTDGHFGIGTGGAFVYNTPDIYSVIGSGSSTDSALFLRTSATGIGRLAFADNSGSDAGRFVGQISYNHTTNAMSFTVSGVEQLEINDTNARFRDGSVSSPGITFLADNDTGIYRDATNQMTLVSGGSNIFRIQSDGSRLISGQFFSPGGSAAAPTYSFNSDPNTGMYNSGPDELVFVCAGVEQGRYNVAGFRGKNGSAASPSIGFLSDANTGLYSPGADAIGFSAGGQIRVTVDTSGLLINDGIVRSTAGTASLPAFTFDGDTDTGMYSDSAGHVMFTTNTVKAAQFTNSQRFQLADSGSAALPTISWISDTDTGVYNPAANALGFVTAGAEAMRIASSGAVSIGTTAGNYDLNFDNNGVLGWNGSGVITGDINLYMNIDGNNDGTTAAFIWAKDRSTTSGGTELMRMPESGELLLGRTTALGINPTVDDTNSIEIGPGYINLFRDDTTGSNQIIFGKNGSRHSGLRTDASGFYILGSDGNSDLQIDTSGNVILNQGITVANSSLTTNGTIRYTGSDIEGRVGGAWVSLTGGTTPDPLLLGAGSAAAPTYSFSTDSDTGMYRSGVNDLAFTCAGTQRMVVESARVLINETLEVITNSSSAAAANVSYDNIVIEDSGSLLGMSIIGNANNVGVIAFGDDADNDAGRLHYNHNGNIFSIYTAGSQQVNIDGSGNVQFNSYGAGTLSTDGSGNITASDGRLKVRLDREVLGKSVILAFKPTWYNWTKESGFDSIIPELGFIAQEIGEVIPEAAPGTDETVRMRNFHDRAVIASLVKCSQELIGENEEIKEENNKLEERIDNLEKLVQDLVSKLQ